MGLDNIPNDYPCKLKNTAVLDEENRIDCIATQNTGGCPWKNEKESNPIIAKANGVYGMLGTDCWYRGKYGNFLIEKMKQYSGDFDNEMDWDFYGDLDETEDSQGGISVDACEHMSMTMFDYSEKWIQVVDDLITKNEIDASERESHIYDWVYAAWWLNFVAKNANGSSVWY